MPLRRTINVIVERIYKDKVIETKLKKSTLKTVLPKLFEEGIIRHYIRYVDDTLVMVRDDKIDEVLERFNKFDKNLRFTVDSFDDSTVHFLDIMVHSNGETDIYSKPTNTGQYSHYNSYIPWGYKISWARALFNRASRICSNSSLFQGQKTRISNILSWNGFPSYIRKKLLKQFSDSVAERNDRPSPVSTNIDDEIDHLSLKIPYMGANGEKLVKTLKRKIRANLSRKVDIRIVYTTNKMSKFCGVKDKIPEDQKHNIIYSIRCPGCGKKYVGKTSCCFRKRMEEHGSKSDQPMYQHLSSCEEFAYLVGLHNLPNGIGMRNSSTTVDSHILEAVIQNSKVLSASDDWLTLAYMEPLLAKKENAMINHGDRAMKSLSLF